MTHVHHRSKVDFIFVSLCFHNNLLFALNLVQMSAWNRFKLLPFLVHSYFRIRHFHRLRHRINLCTNVQCAIELYPSPAMLSSWSFGRCDSKRCLVDSWASTMHVESCWIHHSSLPWHCRLHWNFQLSPCVFDGFFFSFRLPDRWNKYVSTFQHCRDLASRLPVLAFLSSDQLSRFWTKLQATHCLVL